MDKLQEIADKIDVLIFEYESEIKKDQEIKKDSRQLKAIMVLKIVNPESESYIKTIF